MDTLDHGNYSTYYNKKCRCELCKQAAKDYVKAKKAKGLPEGDNRHGTTNGYFSWGCRCELCSAVTQVYTASRKDKQRDQHLSRTFDLTSEQWDDLLASQGGVCASCGDKPDPQAKKRFHTDHDHSSGAVRGILCHGCNVALGHLKDDSTRIRLLADYIDRFNEGSF